MSKHRREKKNHGSQSEHVETGGVKGRALAQQDQYSKGRQERGCVSAQTEEGEKTLAEPSLRLVLVEWVDSYGCSASWQSLAESTPAPMVCRSVGWLLHDTTDWKVIVPHLSDANHQNTEQQGCGDMTIPTRSILSVTDLTTHQA